MSRGGFFAPLGSILKAVVHHHGIDLKLLEYQLRQEWPRIAGSQIAAHTCPDYIRFKKLHLIVESSVWLQHLTFLKSALLEKITEVAGPRTITDLVLRVGDLPAVQEHADASKPTLNAGDVRPSAEARAQAVAAVASVTDPDLRERLTEVLANALSSQPGPSVPERADRRPPGSTTP